MSSSNATIEPSVDVETVLTPKSYADFSAFNAFSANRRGLALALFPAAMAVMGAVNIATGAKVLGTAIAAAGVLLPIAYLAFFRRAVKTQIKANRLDEPRIAYRVRLSEEGLDVSNDREQASYGWDRVYKAYLTGEYAYVYMTPAQAFILPFENIVSGDRNALEAILREHLPRERIATRIKKKTP